MPAETLSCPMCGAPAPSDSSTCAHCGARLATVACPSCFGMMFIGEKFCSHCGAKAQRTELAGTSLACPRCKSTLQNVLIGKNTLQECPQCEGLWADAESVRQICAEKETQSAVLGMASLHAAPPPAVEAIENIHYVGCPVCRQLMNRVNFAQCSGVVVNVCMSHGTWFDHDQLHRIVEFIQNGGLSKTHAYELEDRRKKFAIAAPMTWEAPNVPTFKVLALETALGLIRHFLH